MTKKEVLELFKFIKSVYSQFEVDQYKIDTWSSLLADQDPAAVMKKAERHSMTKVFPPTIAELREPKRREDESVLAQFWQGEEDE